MTWLAAAGLFVAGYLRVFASRRELTNFLDMGSELGAALDRWSVPGLVARIGSRQ